MLTCDLVVLGFLFWKHPLTLPRPREVGPAPAPARIRARAPRRAPRKGDPTVPVIIELEADEAPEICSICLGELQSGGDA